MTERIQPGEKRSLRSYVLTFKTANGDLLAWCVRTSAAPEEVQRLIDSAASEWLLSAEGRKFVHDEQISEWGFDNANALDEIPHQILRKFNILPRAAIDGIIELDPDDNLLPDELRT